MVDKTVKEGRGGGVVADHVCRVIAIIDTLISCNTTIVQIISRIILGQHAIHSKMSRIQYIH